MSPNTTDARHARELAQQEENFVVRNLAKSFVDLYCKVTELEAKLSTQQINNSVLAGRIFDLEEKERQRAREDHDREISIDERVRASLPKPDGWKEGSE